MARVRQLTREFPVMASQFLDERIEESKGIIKSVVERTSDPLIIQFSGGNDSLAMVQLVGEVTDNFICAFMVSGIEFPEAVEFAKKMATKLEVPLLLSFPSDHLGGFFERLKAMRTWPIVHSTWCQRDLKTRPQSKVIHRLLGKQKLYKLVGVRKWESTRRRSLYSLDKVITPDNQTSRDYLVYPILNWMDGDVLSFLESRGLPTSGLYKRYGVSGCYWCPFYQPDIYRRILAGEPDLLDDFIKAERVYGPSVSNYIYLGDIKAAVIAGGRKE